VFLFWLKYKEGGILMTVEEIEIIVTAKIEEALKEFQKIVPTIKKQMDQTQNAFSKINTKEMKNKVQQAVFFIKKKLQEIRKSSANNELAIKVNNKDAQKQISQIQKQIDSLQEKINARKIKLDIITPKLDKIANEPMNKVNPERLENNKQYINLSDKEEVLVKEIQYYNKQLSEAKSKMSQLRQQISQTATTQNKLSSFFEAFKQKIEQVKPSMSSIKNSFKGLPKITQNITNNIKGMGTGLRQGIGNVMKYAMALFSLRSIYSVLSGCANTWLSSQNAGAKQLSANIEYMKYAMGSALAPVIQFVTNLVYQLMKAIQSVAYALTGVNIFAKASASSYASMAGSAKKAKNETKSLSNIHSEINNIQSNDNSDSGNGGTIAPSFDLSGIDNTPNSILDSIKNGDWYKVGVTIGEKLNDAMNSIPWDKIQNTAKKIGTNIAQFLNGFIATTDWRQVGNTIAQGINTAIYLAQSFVHTFNWSGLGSAVANAINGFFKNTNWGALGDTISTGIKGALNGITTFFKDFDWSFIVQGLIDFCKSIDWNGIVDAMFEMLGSAFASFVNLGMILGEKINEAIDEAGNFFSEKIKECGGNVVEGIFKGIIEALGNLGQWIIDHIFTPFIEGFKNVFGIHSPSTVMAELGTYIIQGLLDGISSLVDSIKQIWENIKQTAISIFNSVKDNISNIFNNIKNIASNIWNNITSNIRNAVSNIKNGIVQNFQNAYNSIQNIFSNIGSFFSGVWSRIRNTFSSLGTSIGNAISGAVKSGINGVISLIERTINSAIRLINGGIRLINLIPGVYVGSINTLSLPRLAKGGVLTEATTVIAGEYSGAKTNPEIVTPQNIMRDTFEDVLSNYSGSNNDKPIYLTINVGNQKLGQILLDNLRDKKRRTGKDIEALVGG
jgi:phage-related protein